MESNYIIAEDNDIVAKGDKLYYNQNYEGIEYIEIPNYIHGEKRYSLENFFNHKYLKTNIRGVLVNWDKLKNLKSVFRGLKLDYLEVNINNCENVINYDIMFFRSNIKVLNLYNFEITNDIIYDSILSKNKVNRMFGYLNCEILILPKYFTLDFESDYLYDFLIYMFKASNIKVVKTSNLEFCKKYKDFFKKYLSSDLVYFKND